jgi:hypothetical protein
MKPQDDQLNRLLKAAAAAPRAETGAPGFALESRVLGAWRGLAQTDSAEFLIAWIGRAAICGCMLALATIAWSYHERPSRKGAEMAVAESALNMGVEP